MSLTLRQPAERLDRAAIWWWMLRQAMGWAATFVALVIALAIFDWFGDWDLAVLIGVGVLGVASTVVVPLWRYAVHRWEVTDEAVYVSAGWWVREWQVVPMSRVQTVDTERGPLQQLLGLSTVSVRTASAHGDVRIEGLEHGRAADAVQRIATLAQVTPGDGT